MVKKVISFSLIFLIILLIYQYVINGVKNNHFVEYSIEKDKSYRIMEVSSQANKDISTFLDMKLHKYIGFKFDFKPYNKCIQMIFKS